MEISIYAILEVGEVDEIKQNCDSFKMILIDHYSFRLFVEEVLG